MSELMQISPELRGQILEKVIKRKNRINIDSKDGVLQIFCPMQIGNFSIFYKGVKVFDVQIIKWDINDKDWVYVSYNISNDTKWKFKITNGDTETTPTPNVYVIRDKTEEEKYKVYKSGYMWGFEDIIDFLEEEAYSVTLSMNDMDTYTLKKCKTLYERSVYSILFGVCSIVGLNKFGVL
jgi:hypothetical protein